MMYQNVLSSYFNKTNKQKNQAESDLLVKGFATLGSCAYFKRNEGGKGECHIPVLAIWFQFYLDQLGQKLPKAETDELPSFQIM